MTDHRGQDPTRLAPPATVEWAPFGRTMVLMTATGLLVVGQLYAVIPLLPDMAEAWGTTPSAATWTATSFGFAYAAGFLLTGPLSDRFGRRTVVTLGLALMAVATLTVATATSLTAASALRVVEGLGAAGFAPAALAYLSERIEPYRRSVALTILITSFFAAAVLGQVGAQAVAAVAGWRGVFVASAAGLAVVAVLLRVVMLPDVIASAGSLLGSFRAMGRLAMQPGLALLYLASPSVLGSFVAVYTALQLLGPVALTDHPGAMLALRISALPGMIGIGFAAPLLSRFRPTRRASAALLVGAAATCVVALSGGSLLVIGGAMLVFVVAVAAVPPGLTETVAALSSSARGAGVALFTFALLLGASLGPQLVAALGGWGLRTVLLVTAMVQVVGSALVLAAGRVIARQDA